MELRRLLATESRLEAAAHGAWLCEADGVMADNGVLLRSMAVPNGDELRDKLLVWSDKIPGWGE